MFYLRSTVLTVFYSLAVIGFSGHLASASAKTDAASVKNYAENASATGQQEMTAVMSMPSAAREKAARSDVIISHQVGGCGLRCRAGMAD